jgi:pimeloyl-ACP methyl ester carboxylesterase
MMHPEVVARLIVCNLPHPLAVHRAQRQLYLPQLWKSWYIAFFQLPALPERYCARNQYHVLRQALGHGLPDFGEAEAAIYREAWSQPGALPAMLGYYRALPRSFPLLLRRGKEVVAPTSLIWGDPDFALDTRLAEWSKEYQNGLKLSILPRSSHFVQLRHPEEVSRLMLESLAEPTLAPQSVPRAGPGQLS